MFKRTKKLSPPPTAPSLNEILEDLETFHVEKRLPIRTRILNPAASSYASNTSSVSSGNLSSLNTDSTQEWWKVFETFLYDVEDLKRLKTDLNGYKIKLESCNLEIDTIAKNMQNDIEDQLQQAKLETKDYDQ